MTISFADFLGSGFSVQQSIALLDTLNDINNPHALLQSGFSVLETNTMLAVAAGTVTTPKELMATGFSTLQAETVFNYIANGVAPDVDPPDALEQYQKPWSDPNSCWNLYPNLPTLGPLGQLPTGDAYGTYYNPWVEGSDYSEGIFRTGVSDPGVTIHGGLDFGKMLIADAPYGSGNYVDSIALDHFPDTVFNVAGLDKHCDVIDPSRSIVHSFYYFKGLTAGDADIPAYLPLPPGARWTAGIYTCQRIGSTGWGTATKWDGGPRAAGVPASAGMIRTWEVDRGYGVDLDHALTMSLPDGILAPSPAYIFPATSSDYDASYANFGTIPQGTLLLLHPSFPEGSPNPWVNWIIRCLKKFGAYVTDKNGRTRYNLYTQLYSGLPITTSDYDWLNGIATWLCPVIATRGWKRASDNVNIGDRPSNFNLISMRGVWTNGATYDVYQEKVILPAGAAGTYTSGDDSDLRQVTWAGPTFADVNTLTAYCKNRDGSTAVGVTLKLQIRNGSGTLLRETAALSDGQTATVTLAQFEHTTMEAVKASASADTKAVWFGLIPTSRPTLVSIAVADATPNVLDFTYDKPIWGTLPDPSVYGPSGRAATRVYVDWPQAGGSLVVHVEVDIPVVHGETMTCDYTASGTFDLHDAHDNKAVNLIAHPVTNNTLVDTTPPVISLVSVVEATPNVYNCTTSEVLVGTFCGAAPLSTVSGRAVLSAAQIDSTHFDATVASRLYVGEADSIIYTQPGSNKLQDAAHNLMETQTKAVTNNTTTFNDLKVRMLNLSSGGNAVVESGNGTVGWGYHGVSGGNEGNTLCTPGDKSILDGARGYLIMELVGTTWDNTHGVMFYFGDGLGHYWVIACRNVYSMGTDAGSSGITIVAPAAGDLIRLGPYSNAALMEAHYSKDAGVSWSPIGSAAIPGGAPLTVQLGFYGVNGVLNLHGGGFT